MLGFGLILLFLTGLSPVSADSPGSATATFLKLDPYAESAAQGSALLGRSGIPSLHFNTAGLGFLQSTETSVTQNDIFAGITYQNASLVHSTRNKRGGFGLSFTSMDFGEQDRTRIRGNDPVTGFGQFSANDLSLKASYGWRFHRTFSAGAGLKYVESDIAGFQDGALSGDLGLQYRIPTMNWRFGLTGRNLFGSLELNERSDPLPRVYEIGGNYRLSLVPDRHEFDFGFGTGTSNDSDGYFFGGIEYGLFDLGSLRFGYHGAQDAGDGMTFGAGFHYGGIQVDYAYVPFGDLGRQQRFSFGYQFGRVDQTTPETEDTGLKARNDEQSEGSGSDVQKVASRVDRAKQLYRAGSVKESYDVLRNLHRHNPNNVDVLLWLGLLENEMENRQLAIDRMKRVLELDPDNDYAQKNLQKLKNE
jgi:hypothetical protein